MSESTSPPPNTDSGTTSPTGSGPGGTPPTGTSNPPGSPPPGPTNQPTGQPSGSPPPASGSPPPPPTNSAPPTTPTPSATPSTQIVSTVVETTFITTNAQGETTQTVSSTLIPSTTVVSSGQSKGLSGGARTGAIVGGVLGGIAVLAVLALALWWCLARRRRRDEFDGNFDPDHISGGPSPMVPDMGPVDLNDGPAPDPYTYGSENGMAYAGAGGPVSQPSQYSTSHAGTSDYDYHRGGMMPNPYDSHLSPGGVAAAGAVGAAAYAGGSHTSGSESTPRSAKEREAMRPHVANPDGVIVHQDAGRYREDDPPQPSREIPPTYNSIPEDVDRR